VPYSSCDDPVRCQFASDNYAGICPEAWQAMTRANATPSPAYGNDAWTFRAADMLRDLFEVKCEVFFAFNGTASNALALASLCQSYHSIICHEMSHVETDECGAPEFFSNGTKLLLVSGPGGKISPETLTAEVSRRNDIHFPKPRVISLTQATELGTVYTIDELRARHEVALRFNLRMHMDGARFANAVATLNVAPKEITWKVGIDVLCFGGTKNGMAVGEAVIFFKKELAEEFAWRCKQAGQLASKMRYLSAPWVGMLESGAWLKNGEHANHCAARLRAGLEAIRGIEFIANREANSVFVRLPPAISKGLEQRGWKFYTFIGAGARFMCSWSTTEADVDALINDVRELYNA
jgi:threonine aldolase